MVLTKKEGKSEPTWVTRLLKDLNREGFTGSIRINFFKGDISKKIEKTSFVSEK